MTQHVAEICIVGAGAAGLWAAGVCARRGAQVILLEKMGKTGTKVLASGGSRCNLTTSLDPRAAAQCFRHEGAKFLGPAVKALSPRHIRERFHGLGVPTKVETEFAKVFPASDSARDVRDALEQEARRHGATILVNSRMPSNQSRTAGSCTRPTSACGVTASCSVRAAGAIPRQAPPAMATVGCALSTWRSWTPSPHSCLSKAQQAGCKPSAASR
ncbi:MAG: NAD(P)/FAD-dependent oxidoreductase [Deltaproteobacteria bacterium]|nr:NAD(P)/FAD-dependent oxidoreductase [Deltaproteobacteria bacterium]